MLEGKFPLTFSSSLFSTTTVDLAPWPKEAMLKAEQIMFMLTAGKVECYTKGNEGNEVQPVVALSLSLVFPGRSGTA